MTEGDLNSDGKQKCEKKINIQYSSGRPFNGRGRGGKKVRVIDSDDDDDLELDDSEVVEDSDIFTNDNDYDIIQPEPHIQPETRKKEKVCAQITQDFSHSECTKVSVFSCCVWKSNKYQFYSL
jgi:hypothetical protein